MIIAIVQSLTGNTMSFIDYLRQEEGERIIVKTPRDFKKDKSLLSLLEIADKVMIGTYTWDNGKIPKPMKDFVIEHRELLILKQPLIFGSGWSIYENFCGAVDGISIILENKNPTIKYELRFNPSLETESLKTFMEFNGGQHIYV